MSAKQDTSNTMMMCCASCGVAEGDGIQLKKCNGCYLVRYCGVTCQRNHRPEHKKACKKRAAELRDEILFRQPESSHLGDCPICLLPFPFDEDQSVYHTCCSKLVCRGCVFANFNREMEERLESTCPFCRADVREGIDINEENQKIMKRVQANDPIALCKMGTECNRKGNHVQAFQYYSKAAEQGNAYAHSHLFLMYSEGRGVEKDEKKELYHLEEAAIGGHPIARNLLAGKEWESSPDRSIKHLIIAANLGHDQSITGLKDFYKAGLVSKEDFAAALRAHKAAVDATKSPRREAAAVAWARSSS